MFNEMECLWHSSDKRPKIPSGYHFCPYCRRHRFLYFKPYELIFILFLLLFSGLVVTAATLKSDKTNFQEQRVLFADTPSHTPIITTSFTPIPTFTRTTEPTLFSSSTPTTSLTPSPIPTATATPIHTLTPTYVPVSTRQINTAGLLLNFTENYIVQDLDIEFLYPAGYITDASDGIRIAANEADMAAGLDNNDSTAAKGYTFQLNAFSRTEILSILNLSESVSFNKIVESIAEEGGLDVQDQLEVPHMGYSSIVLTGTNEFGRNGIIVFWMRDDYVVFASMGIANSQPLNDDTLFTFRQWLATFRDR